GLQLVVGGAQLFLLGLQRQLGALQFLGLGAGAVKQQLGFIGAADVVQAQRHRRQHAVDEGFLGRAEMAEGAELEHPQQAVLEQQRHRHQMARLRLAQRRMDTEELIRYLLHADALALQRRDRKSTRLNSSHVKISYAVFCLKKKKEESDSINS